MNIKITSDSTIDLPRELLDRYGISTMPLEVRLGDELFRDGIDVDPPKIYAFVERTGVLPKTAARNSEVYGAFFRSFLDNGYDAVIHYALSSGISASCECAKAAAAELGGRVLVVDTLALSTGTALLAIDGAEQAAAGKSADAIFARSVARVPHVQTSFVVDRLEYLYKGGRCSKLAVLGANLLKIKPSIIMKDGVLGVGKKFRGKLAAVVEMYVDYILESFPTPDPARIFITHTEIDPEIVDAVRAQLEAKGIFREILETLAGSTITSHCGRGTLGILYLNDGPKN